MNQGRMQMDWVRYYTLARPDAQSIKAPQADGVVVRRRLLRAVTPALALTGVKLALV